MAASSAQAAFPGAPGRIAFQSSRTGGDDIYSANADGSGIARLTSSAAFDGEPSWSADGGRIVFDSSRDGNSEIYVMNADGSGQVNVSRDPATDLNADWSPDGTRIVFASSRTAVRQLFVIDADGSNVFQLTDVASPAQDPVWSPDGTQIAFDSRISGTDQIWLIKADGTNLRQITNMTGGGFTGDADWSPDGTKLVFDSAGNGPSPTTGEIFVINADGTGLLQLTNGPTVANFTPFFSPDGASIGFDARATTGAPSQIRIMDADGSHRRDLATGAGNSVAGTWQALPAGSPPPTDGNNDGIADVLQPSGTAMGSFVDSSLAPPTSGSITNAAGLLVTIDDASAPAAGVRVTVGPGVGRATLSVCGGFAVTVAAGSQAVITCGSVTVQVVSGSAQIVLFAGATIVNVPAGVTAKVIDNLDGSFQIQDLGGGTLTVTSSGTVTTLAPGSTTRAPSDGTNPKIALTSPANGASYALGAAVTAQYTCSDEPGGSGLASCVGSVPDGAPVDTSSPGMRTFTVDASDNAGNTATQAVQYTVQRGITATALASSLNPSVVGQSVTYTATVTALAPASGSPTQTVAFSDGTSVIAGCGAVALSATGKATCTATYATAGAHAIKALYGGDSRFAGSSNSLTQTVNKAATKLVAAKATRTLGKLTFKATLTRVFDNAPIAGRAITFAIPGRTVCTATTNSTGVASCTVTGLAIGQGSYSAAYAGDANTLGATTTAPL